jgi:hypothetical protein
MAPGFVRRFISGLLIDNHAIIQNAVCPANTSGYTFDYFPLAIAQDKSGLDWQNGQGVTLCDPPID